MEQQQLLKADYLDIIFDNRNKTYGGYELRSKYPDRARRAAIVVVVSACLLSSIPVIAGILEGKKKPPITLTNCGPVIIRDVLIPKQDIPPVKPVTKISEAVPVKATIAILPPKIVENDKVPLDAPKLTDSVGDRATGLHNNIGSPDGTTPDFGQEAGKGSGFAMNTIDKPEIIDPIRLPSEMPAFIGNLEKYLVGHLKYPEAARETGDEGKAIVEFVVDEDGAVTRPVIKRSTGSKALDNEALRVVSAMPHWKPGRQHGKAVKVYFMIPLIFMLD